jgi:hypothetical protein
MKKIIKQIKKESLAIQEHARLVKRSHILKCDIRVGDDINIIQDKTKLVLGLIEELEKK